MQMTLGDLKIVVAELYLENVALRQQLDRLAKEVEKLSPKSKKKEGKD